MIHTDLCSRPLHNFVRSGERLEELSEEFARLTTEAHTLEERISANVASLLEAE